MAESYEVAVMARFVFAIEWYVPNVDQHDEIVVTISEAHPS